MTIQTYYYYLKHNSQRDSGSPLEIQLTGPLPQLPEECFFGKYSNSTEIPQYSPVFKDLISDIFHPVTLLQFLWRKYKII